MSMREWREETMEEEKEEEGKHGGEKKRGRREKLHRFCKTSPGPFVMTAIHVYVSEHNSARPVSYFSQSTTLAQYAAPAYVFRAGSGPLQVNNTRLPVRSDIKPLSGPFHGRAAPAGHDVGHGAASHPSTRSFRPGHRRLPQRHYRAIGKKAFIIQSSVIADAASLYFLRPLFAPKVKIPPPAAHMLLRYFHPPSLSASGCHLFLSPLAPGCHDSFLSSL
ncbi:hypothetical protein WMY93_024635 [Mugilogobius chulae]|uniref:Uncharacterized protein n=1 Tax=Mugilogobius chulae TaxID=88201 RepID=A0AAW0N052_9GOBI